MAYVYVPNTADLGHAYFKRYFFPQADREGIIVDERFNGGGSVADYYIDILRRPVVSYWAMRHGAPIRTPGAAILGPKVMLIDETAGSGGDLLPWMFRRFQLGTLIGRRTWGGLVGILGFPTLLDGGRVTAPRPGVLRRGRLAGRERGRAARRRGRAMARRRDGRQGPAARPGHRDRPRIPPPRPPRRRSIRPPPPSASAAIPGRPAIEPLGRKLSIGSFSGTWIAS